MINIRKFITEEDVTLYRKMSNDAIKEYINNFSDCGRRKFLGIPDGDIDILLEQMRENNFTSFCRKDEWTYDWVKIMNDDGNIYSLKTREAVFRYINKWNQEEGFVKYKIIIDENNKIMWMGNNNQYFISSNKKIYALKYEHKYLKLFPNICLSEDYFIDNDDDRNDALVKKYRENKEEKCIYISLEEHFEKRFFSKGFKWNKNWNKYYSWDYITILIDIYAKNSLFYIEIENITYPFYGHVILDLNEIKIIEAKKI